MKRTKSCFALALAEVCGSLGPSVGSAPLRIIVAHGQESDGLEVWYFTVGHQWRALLPENAEIYAIDAGDQSIEAAIFWSACFQMLQLTWQDEPAPEWDTNDVTELVNAALRQIKEMMDAHIEESDFSAAEIYHSNAILDDYPPAAEVLALLRQIDLLDR
jgi:hypothetical protein